MIFLCGLSGDSPLEMVAAELERRGSPYVWFRQRGVAVARMTLELKPGATDAAPELVGTLEVEDEAYPLEMFTGVYARMMEDTVLPEVQSEPPNSPLRRHSRALHEGLTAWTESVPEATTRVVNRASAMASNNSKPYQAQGIAVRGFRTPDTVVTNDPDVARAFRERHGEVIYKSVSGVRSVVRTLTDADDSRLEHIRWCPTQFQARVKGTDIRVHVIGNRTVFATAITTTATDYRYAARDGQEVTLTPYALPDDIAHRCIGLARDFGLSFAGIDLRRTEEGEFYCFEVNPSPAFSYYESHTDQPIAAALVSYLEG